MLILKLCHEPGQASSASPVQVCNAAPTQVRAQFFFATGAEPFAHRSQLMYQSHFVYFDNQLKSLKIPSLTFDVAAQEVLLNWRQLVSSFLHDQLRCRSHASMSAPWSAMLPRKTL